MYADSGGIYGLWQRSFTSLKKERGIRPLTAGWEKKSARTCHQRKYPSCAKLIFFYITKEKIRIIGDRLIDPKEWTKVPVPVTQYRTEQKYFLNFFCRFGKYSYLYIVLSASHVRLTKRRYETFDCSIPRRTATPKRKDEQTLPHWSGRFMRKLQHMW